MEGATVNTCASVPDPALVSDQAPSGLAASRFDPSRAIGFTGTQHRWTPEQGGRLSSVLLAAFAAGAEWMNNGDCLGSDARAAQNWTMFGGKLRLYPPDIDKKRAFLFATESMPPRPYLERNRNIVRDCAALIATPKEDFEELRSGTWATIRYARKLKRPIIIVWPLQTPTAENWPGTWSSVFRDGPAIAQPTVVPSPNTPKDRE